MSTVEEQLAQDIAEATRGVVVTDSDLRDAWAGINDRIESERPDRRRTVVAVAAAAVIVLVLGVAAFLTLDGDDTAAPPAKPGPSPTPSIDNHADFLVGRPATDEALRGIWRLDNGGVIMRFAAPDLVSIDREGRVFENPGIQGRYAIDGENVTITIDGGPSGCGGQQIAMRASVPKASRLRFVITEQGKSACVGLQDQRLVMERVLPTDPGFASFRAEKHGWLPLTDSHGLYGTWFAQGGGYVLELGLGGTYHVATGTGEQVDYGGWTLKRTRLTLTSWPDSVGCTTNDKLVMGDMEFVRSGTTSIRFTVRQNDCGGAWTPKAWFLVPYEGS
jgi:hypothetical protein